MKKNRALIVIALGGNALNSSEGQGGYFEQFENAKNAAKEIGELVRMGFKTVITHGNGPQVGDILLQQEYSRDQVSPMPLSVCGAQSQGQIGTILVGALNNEFKKLNLKTRALTLITHVLVDSEDPAFQNPTKPIGPFYTPTEAKKLRKKGFFLREIMVGAYRRVVASPQPLKILEIKGIKAVLEGGLVPIAVGGGGIPVIMGTRGLELIDAVIDKDRASQVLAREIGAETLVILTNVRGAALHFQKPNQKWLNKMTLAEAKQYLEEGHFSPGSMGPKVEAGIRFIENGGRKAIIAHLRDLALAVNGKAGTTIT